MAKRNSKANNTKALIIAIIAMILVVAIAFCILYFAFPKTWNDIMQSVFGTHENDNSDLNSGNDNQSTQPPLSLGDGELKVHFVNVGQGDCIYIQFPNNTDMLIDCGNKSTGYNFQNVKNYLDALNPDGKINHLMLTHSDEDHVDNMDEIIYAYEIENIYMPNILADPTNQTLKDRISELDPDKVARFDDPHTITTATYANFFIAALSEQNCNVFINEDRDENTNSIVIAQETFRLTFYCPTEEYYDTTNLNNAERKNAVSPIGVLEYNNRRVVLTGDSNEINEPIFVRRIGGSLDCDVLKVGHHGSETSTTNAFLNAISCEYAVISCNKLGNTFIHPRQATLDRLKAHNMTVYRTDRNGTIVLTIDGESQMSFAVETEASQETIFIGADTENANASPAAMFLGAEAYCL